MKIQEMRKRQMKVNATGDIPDLDQFLKDNIRQVRWLYNNSNKCTEVIDYKTVYRIVSEYKNKIASLRFALQKAKVYCPKGMPVYDIVDEALNNK